MDYKKKYEKLVDAVKVLRDNNPSDEGIQNWVNDNVPELKESEDERIKKAILEGLIDCRDAPDLGWSNFGGIEIDDCIAWLEKQCKETSWKPSKEEMDVLYCLAYITSKYDEYKEEVITRLYQDLKREFFNGSSYENMFPNTEDGVRRRSTIQVLEYARSLDNYNQYGKADIDKNIAWLEKQDIFSKKDVDDAYLKGVTDTKNEIEKQYEANYQIRKDIATFIFNYKGDIKDRAKWMNYLGIKVSFVKKQGEKPQGKSALEAIREEKVDNANKIEPKDYSSIDPYFGKPIDKVEPNFKVGDWITNGHYTWKVISVDNFDYTLQNQCGEYVEDTIDYVDEAFRLFQKK
jgi:hypothetical protein